MRYSFIIFIVGFYSCSTVPQIQLPDNTTATKRYVDSSILVQNASMRNEVDFLKSQNAQYKKTVDSLRSAIIISTIKIDTTTAGDFSIRNGVMTFNKPNLSKMIKSVVSQIPTQKTIAKNKRIK